MPYSVALLLLSTILIAQSQFQYNYDDTELEGNPCVTVQHNNNVNGTCLTIQNCPSVLSNVVNLIFNHTVCGYDDLKPIICCPNDGTQLQKTKTLNLKDTLECQVVNSNATGVMKFLSHCPELNTNGTAADHINKLCDYEICGDLVCCPIATLKNRLKNVCSKVDHPLETLKLRLERNDECTIKGLNVKGRYQQYCDYAERNPELALLVQNVCNDDLCRGWYCCPNEDVDICGGMLLSPPFEMVGPKCIDTKTGRQGTCKKDPLSYFEPNALDKCGSYCCIDYYCYPDVINVDKSVKILVSAKACLSFTSYLLKKEVVEVPMGLFNNNCTSFGEIPSASSHSVAYSYESVQPLLELNIPETTDCTSCNKVYEISAGRPTYAGNFPHMAALGYELNQEILWKCGGSLISDRFVLTAAHCLSNQIGPVKRVRLGVVNLLTDESTPDCPEEYGVAKQILHPDYTPLHVYNDIGLIELDARVNFNYHIRPICLPSSSDIPQNFESMGWGALGPNTQQTSFKLLSVFQTLFSNEECNELYRHYPNRKLNNGISNDTQICAGSRFSIQITCNGDSGGPLQGRSQSNSKTFEIYGIVSTGTSCGFANSPGIYTKVFPYVGWIEGTVWSISLN